MGKVEIITDSTVKTKSTLLKVALLEKKERYFSLCGS